MEGHREVARASSSCRSCGWDIAPACVLRMAGFAFEQLETVRFPETTTAAERTLEAEAHARHYAGRLAILVRGRMAGTRRKKALGALRKLTLPRIDVLEGRIPGSAIRHYARAVESLEVQRREMESTFAAEMDRAADRARVLARDDRFLEAVLLSNPKSYETIRRLGEAKDFTLTSRSRRHLNLVVRYLQRFCAKNESTSFFGPTSIGPVLVDGPQRLAGRARGQLRKRTRTFAHWAACDLARSSGIGTGFLAKAPEPLAALAARLRGRAAGTDTLRAVCRLRACMEQFGTASREQKGEVLERMGEEFGNATGMRPYRRDGRQYGDRMLVHEDAEYDFKGLSLNRVFIDEIVSSCEPLFEVVAYLGSTYCAEQRRGFGKWLKGTGRSRMTVAECASMARRDRLGLARHLGRARSRWFKAVVPLLSGLRSMTDKASGTDSIELSADDRRFIRERTEDAHGGNWPVIFSPDILVAAESQSALNRGEYTIVVGEIHPTLGIAGFYARIAGRSDVAKKASEEILQRACDTVQPVDFVTATDNKTALTLDLDTPEIPFNIPQRPGRVSFDHENLWIVLRGTDVSLEVEGSEKPLVIYSQVPRRLNLVPLKFFCLPRCATDLMTNALLAGRDALVRIRHRKAIIHRACWVVSTDSVAAIGKEKPIGRRFAEARRAFSSWGGARAHVLPNRG